MYDAPNLQNKNFILSSIVNMTGIDHELTGDVKDESEVIRKVGLDKESDVSIYSYIFSARENTRSARHVLSDELWEAINEYFLFVNGFSQDYYETKGLYEFTQQINKRSYAIKSTINHTLLHETAWMMINLGMFLERTIQVVMTMRSKLIDIDILSENGKNAALKEYQWTVTLKILEAFDIYRRYFRNSLAGLGQSSFIIYHETFPRSVVYNLNKVHEMATRLQRCDANINDGVFFSGRLYSNVKYSRKDKIKDLPAYMDDILERLYELHDIISVELFNETFASVEHAQEKTDEQSQS